MALRLFLVGVVSILALDLPESGPSVRDARTWVDSRIAALPATLPDVVVEEEIETPLPTTEVASAIEPAKPAAPVAMIRPMPTIAPSLAEWPAIAEAPAVAPAPVAVAEDASPAAQPAPAPKATITVIDEPEPGLVVVESKPEVDPDAAFRGIVSKMASEFAADAMASAPAPAPAPEVAPALLAEADTWFPMSPEATEPPAEEVAALDQPTTAPEIIAVEVSNEEAVAEIVEDEQPEAVAEPSDAPSRADRLADAVRLTGQAMNAWAGLLSQRPTVASLRR